MALNLTFLDVFPWSPLLPFYFLHRVELLHQRLWLNCLPAYDFLSCQRLLITLFLPVTISISITDIFVSVFFPVYCNKMPWQQFEAVYYKFFRQEKYDKSLSTAIRCHETGTLEAGGPTVAQTSRLVSFLKVVFMENADSSAASSTLYLRQAK